MVKEKDYYGLESFKTQSTITDSVEDAHLCSAGSTDMSQQVSQMLHKCLDAEEKTNKPFLYRVLQNLMFMNHCSGLNREECCNLCNSDQTENCPGNPEANLEERLQQDVSFIASSYTTCTPNAPFVVHAVKSFSQTEAE